MAFRVLDLFSGIGSFSLAFQRAGAEIAAHVEIDKNRQAILHRHFPDVPQLGDIFNVKKENIEGTVDLICGGSPCQNLSIAGNRQGLAGTESRLWFEYLRLVSEIRPRWIVWENVFNALSSNGGRDFRTILMGLDECGYMLAWRILDAQYFGVPQRRRRVFIVGNLRGGSAAKVLFESESLLRAVKTREKTGELNTLSGTLTGNAGGTARPAGQKNETDFIVYAKRRSDDYQESDLAATLTKHDAIESYGLVSFTPSYFKRGFGARPRLTDVANTVQGNNGRGHSDTDENILHNQVLRRFTPLETERLQGFPDGWTEGFSDSVRYSAIGDSIAVPHSEWIANRIMKIEEGAEVS